jgi:hypothetical protein
MKETGLSLRVVSASNAANCNNNGNANNNTASNTNYVAAIIVCAKKILTQGLTEASRPGNGTRNSSEDKERESFGLKGREQAGRRALIRQVVLSASCTFLIEH